MALEVITEPTEEPLTTADAKDYDRVDGSDEDAIFASLITAAREQCEGVIGRAIARATYRLTLDAFPDDNGPIVLPRPPLYYEPDTDAPVIITYTDGDGEEQELSPDAYFVDASSEPARIVPAYNTSWPNTLRQINAVKVVFTAGYRTVPEGIKQAMRLLIDHWYENREAASEKTLTEIPMGVCALLGRYSYGNYP